MSFCPSKREFYRPLSLMCLIYLFGSVGLAQEYGFDAWTTKNGLPQNTVTSIVQTPDGYLWLSTFDGLARFDGVKFTIFDKGNSKGIINNRFNGVFANQDGSLWAWTENGVLTIYHEGFFTSYATPEGLRETITGILQDANGHPLIETRERYYYFQDGRFILAPEQKERGSRLIYYGKSGATWLIEPHGITRKKDGLSYFYPIALNPEWLLDTYGYHPFEDRQGALWIAMSPGLQRLLPDGGMTRFSEHELPELKDLSGSLYFEDTEGSVWVLLTEPLQVKPDKIARFKDGSWSVFESGVREFWRDALVDREGNFWFSSNSGLRRWRRQIVTALSAKDGLIDNEIYPLLETSTGSTYIGTPKGVDRYSNGKIISLGLKWEGYPIHTRGFWEDSKGRIWIGYFGGFGRLENDRLKQINTKIIDNGATDFAQDNMGNLWIATGEGLYEYKEDKEIAHYTVADGLPHNEVVTIHFDHDGHLWAGTFGGLAQFKDGKFITYGEDVGMPTSFVRYIYEDAEGVLWFGTYGDGLVRYKDGKFFNYRVEDGLFNNGVFAILEDRRGNFWMSSNRGLHRVPKQELNDFADGKIPKLNSVSYDESDGMLNIECNGGRLPSAIKTRDGKFWFPTMGGVAIVDPEAEPANPNPPPVLIENATVDRKTTPPELLQTAIENPQSQIEMLPGQTNLEIIYTGLSLVKSGQVKFRYKLEDFEENWVEAGTSRTANYSYLPAGSYTFHVIAANANGVWNTEGARVKIIVRPYFYQTWWFRVFAALAIALMIGLIYQNRISQLRKIAQAKSEFSRRLIESQERERKRIASELHDGLGQSLAIISNRASMGKTKNNDPEIVAREFEEISTSALEALDEVQEITNNLHPHYLERLGLTKAIKSMLLKVSEVLEVSGEIDLIDNIFPKEMEINVFRIVQESVNNIIKHSDAAEADIKIKSAENEIVITIKDDGRGFDTDNIKSKGSGLGLVSLKERTNMIGGKISINSSVGNGTEIKVILPLKLS
jgi:signal transduction histidine kinase/ligand-binding sensor domain-containing protein